MYPSNHHKKRHVGKELEGNLSKIKPPTFDGEHKKGEDVEAWLLRMKKYL